MDKNVQRFIWVQGRARSLLDLGRLTSENRPQRGQFLPDFQAHSPAMGQKDGEKWTAAVDLQPTIPKSDSLLAAVAMDWHASFMPSGILVS